MESNTNQIQRVLLLWLELNRALNHAHSTDQGPLHSLPWNSPDVRVREIWRRLTDPTNLLALEQWLCQSAEGQSAEWARRALQACRERTQNRPN